MMLPSLHIRWVFDTPRLSTKVGTAWRGLTSLRITNLSCDWRANFLVVENLHFRLWNGVIVIVRVLACGKSHLFLQVKKLRLSDRLRKLGTHLSKPNVSSIIFWLPFLGFIYLLFIIGSDLGSWTLTCRGVQILSCVDSTLSAQFWAPAYLATPRLIVS